MRRRLILIAAGLLAFPAGAAFASASADKAEEPQGQYVDIAQVALPVVYEGRLLNYVFISVRLNLSRSANANALRAKEPFFRDALVRLAHRRPFTRLDDFTRLDEAALKAAFAPEAARIAGPRMVEGVQVTTQAPKQRSGLPRPPQAPGGRNAPPGRAPPGPAAH